MFVLDIPGGDLVAVDTEGRIAVLEEVLVDTSASVTGPDLVLVDTLAGVAVLEEVLIDTLAEVAVIEKVLVDTAATISALEEVLVDTLAAVIVSDAILVDTRLLINPPASFIHAAGNVYFPWGPQRPAFRKIALSQQRGRDSKAAIYVYAKGGARVSHSLVFPRVDTATLMTLQEFVRVTVKGIRHPFTWRDHLCTERTVRLASPRLRHRQTGPDRHRVEIDVEEL